MTEVWKKLEERVGIHYKKEDEGEEKTWALHHLRIGRAIRPSELDVKSRKPAAGRAGD